MNERDVLNRFQNQTPHLRPLIDEIKEPSDPPTIVLEYLDDHLLNASIKKTLDQKELKYVSRCILSALVVLHENGYVHTGEIYSKFYLDVIKSNVADVKPDNILVNYTAGDVRFSNVQLGDLGGTYPADSKYAKEGTPAGAPMWTSPEVII